MWLQVTWFQNFWIVNNTKHQPLFLKTSCFASLISNWFCIHYFFSFSCWYKVNYRHESINASNFIWKVWSNLDLCFMCMSWCRWNIFFINFIEVEKWKMLSTNFMDIPIYHNAKWNWLQLNTPDCKVIQILYFYFSWNDQISWKCVNCLHISTCFVNDMYWTRHFSIHTISLK